MSCRCSRVAVVIVAAAIASAHSTQAQSLASADDCTLHNSCKTCLADSSCGWCTGSIGGANPGNCLSKSSKASCPTIFETGKCPDCHLPWIRFANTVPSENKLDCTITQGSTTKTWTNYAFAEFSDWSQTFKVGPATIAISSGGAQLVSRQLPLTPGPLVVVVKNIKIPSRGVAASRSGSIYGKYC